MNKKIPKISEVVVEKDFNLAQSIEDTIQNMLKDKEENPDLIIPYSFLEFYNKPEMHDLILAVFEYCKCLAQISSKINQLQDEGKHREASKYSQVHSSQLPELGKNAAQKYGELLLKQRKHVNKLDDQNFFETIIYFLTKVMQPGFRKEQLMILDEELNRLFRSTAFNLVERKHLEEEKMKKFPQLKRTNTVKDLDALIRNIMRRSNYRKEKSKGNTLEYINRPGFVKITPFKAITSRSPLISLLLPSPRDKIRAFEESRKKINTKKLEKLKSP